MSLGNKIYNAVENPSQDNYLMLFPFVVGIVRHENGSTLES
jgi:hypothetical protein